MAVSRPRTKRSKRRPHSSLRLRRQIRCRACTARRSRRCWRVPLRHFRPASRAEMFAADVYCGLPTGGAVEAVAAAFGWMAKERVAVINVSLVGPRNALLERVVKVLVARGHLIVAAVGNDGPGGATALSRRLPTASSASRPSTRNIACCSRPAVASTSRFAAPGADLTPRRTRPMSTGYRGARHFVRRADSSPACCALRARVTRSGGQRETHSRRWTAHCASISGQRGRDDIYGAGLVAADLPLIAQPAGKRL